MFNTNERTSMRMPIIIVICSMLVLEGCYYYSALDNEGYVQKIPSPEEAILVHTKNGRDIELEAYHFIEVREPSDFVYGVGDRAGKDAGWFVPFCGKIRPVAQRSDSVFVRVGGGNVYECVYRFLFTLQDGSIVRMKESDCIVVDSARGIGLWTVVKRWNEGRCVGSVDRISFGDIKSIGVQRFSIVKTGLLTIAVASIAYGIVYLMMCGGGGSFGGGTWSWDLGIGTVVPAGDVERHRGTD